MTFNNFNYCILNSNAQEWYLKIPLLCILCNLGIFISKIHPLIWQLYVDYYNCPPEGDKRLCFPLGAPTALMSTLGQILYHNLVESGESKNEKFLVLE